MAAELPDGGRPAKPAVNMQVKIHGVRIGADGKTLSDDTTLTDSATLRDLLPILMKDRGGMTDSAAITMLLPMLMKEHAETPRPSSPRTVMRLVWVALSIIGGAFVAHGHLSYRDDAAAHAAFLASPSCAAERLDTPVVAPGSDGCRIERATIVSLAEHTGKGGHRYSFRVRQPSARTEGVAIGGDPMARQFWARQKRRGSVWLQRFVSPGYRLTGRVSRIADDSAAVTSVESPVTRAQPNGVEVLLGLLMLPIGIFGLGSTFRRGV